MVRTLSPPTVMPKRGFMYPKVAASCLPAVCCGEMEQASLPGGVCRRFHVALAALLPDAVCQLVSDRRHHLDELYRPVIQVEGADTGEVRAKVSVYT